MEVFEQNGTTNGLEPAIQHTTMFYRTNFGSQVGEKFGWQLATTAFGIMATLFYWMVSTRRAHPKGPMIGRRHFWEPAFVVGMRFARNSRGVLNEGYQRVRLSILV